MSRERKSLRGTSGLRSPILAYTRFILFPFSSVFLPDSHLRITIFVFLSIFFFLLFSLIISSFNRRRAGETKSDSYDSSKLQFDAPRLLLEAEGVVKDNSNEKRGEERGRRRGMRKKANGCTREIRRYHPLRWSPSIGLVI